MIQTEIIDTNNKSQVKEFVDFHYQLYEGTPQWVPPFYSDIQLMLNKEKHPYSTSTEYRSRMEGPILLRYSVDVE